MLALVPTRILPSAVEATVAWPGAGAVLTFLGVTRDNFGGRRVTGLVYEAFSAMAIPEMAAIRDAVTARWPEARLAIVHRTGAVDVGEISVAICVATPHRAEAYEASRFAIDALKARVPIWKKERYADGEAWKANQAG